MDRLPVVGGAPGHPPRLTVDLEAARVTRWVGGLLDRHGPATWSHDDGAVVITCADGTVARLTSLDPGGAPGVTSLRALAGWPRQHPRLVIVLVRRGRFAVGLADGDEIVAHASGSRYVQSRTAAGGWSQQRYQRRRANQADALVDHVVRRTLALLEHPAVQAAAGDPLRWPQAVVLGGDRGLAESTLRHPRLARWGDLPRWEAYDLPDPTHRVLREVLARARGVRARVQQPGGRVASMTAETMSAARELIPAATRTVTELVESLPAAAWDRPSPCEGWTVRDVLDHLTTEHLWAPRLLGGETLEQVGDDYDGDVLGSDPVESWRSAATRSVLAWAEVTDEHRVLQMSYGPCSVGEYARQMLVDLVVHAWDLARGAGTTVDPVPEAVDEALRYETPRVEAAGVEGLFDGPVPTRSTDRLDQLVALLGRDPGWRA